MIPRTFIITCKNIVNFHFRFISRACLSGYSFKFGFSQATQLSQAKIVPQTPLITSYRRIFTLSQILSSKQPARNSKNLQKQKETTFKWKFSFSGILINFIPIAILSVIIIIFARRVKEIFSKVVLFNTFVLSELFLMSVYCSIDQQRWRGFCPRWRSC